MGSGIQLLHHDTRKKESVNIGNSHDERLRMLPEFDEQGGAWSDYFYNNFINDPKQASKPDCPNIKRPLDGITDGSSNTVLVGHGNVRTDQYLSNANVTMSTNIFRGGTTGTMRAGDNGEVGPRGVTLQSDSANVPTAVGADFPQGALISSTHPAKTVRPNCRQSANSRSRVAASRRRALFRHRHPRAWCPWCRRGKCWWIARRSHSTSIARR